MVHPKERESWIITGLLIGAILGLGLVTLSAWYGMLIGSVFALIFWLMCTVLVQHVLLTDGQLRGTILGYHSLQGMVLSIIFMLMVYASRMWLYEIVLLGALPHRMLGAALLVLISTMGIIVLTVIWPDLPARVPRWLYDGWGILMVLAWLYLIVWLVQYWPLLFSLVEPTHNV